MLALTLLASLWLAAAHYHHAAISLWIAFTIAAAITIAGKLLFLDCITDTVFGIRSPSGHVALSLATYGMLGILCAQAARGMFRAIINVTITFLIITIAFSRVMLGFHTVPEVLFGLFAGFCGLLFASDYFFNWKQELLRFNVLLMLLALAGVAFAIRGANIPAEEWLKQGSSEVRHYVPICDQPSQGGNTSRESKSS